MASASAALVAAGVLAAGAVANLPDDRGYELVSPAAKNGADVIAQSNKTHAAADGDGVAFSVLAAFGDVLGTSADVEYLSRRTGDAGTSGWSTHAISPRNSAATFEAIVTENVPTFESAFTPNLTSAVYRSWRPLTNSPNEEGVSNLYRLDGLDAREPGVSLLTRADARLADVDPGLRMFMKSAFQGASEDLTHVIFESPWSLTGDGSFSLPRSLYEYADGAGVRLVGRIPDGGATECDDARAPACIAAFSSRAGISATPSGYQYSAGMISEDGQRILFQVPGGGAPEGAIYLRQNGTTTVQVNASEKSLPELPGTASAWGMSADGSRVFFTTAEGLVDGDDAGDSDLYMYEADAPAGARLTIVSVDETPDPHSVRDVIGISRDGRYVYFVSSGQLVDGEPAADASAVFVWHDGQIAFIGSLGSPLTTLINTPLTTFKFIFNTKTSRVSPDGRHLLFMAHSDEGLRGRGGFDGYDHGSTCTYDGIGVCRELYLYSADSGRLACVSCNPLATVATGDAITDVRVGASASVQTQHLSHALSDDGRRVFFSTTEAMVPEDSNGKWDAYEYDVQSGKHHLISTGKSPSDSYFLDASPSGDDVFFVTRERLLGWDVDDNYDLYDARVGGGFPEPVAPAAGCAGESCRPPGGALPAGNPVASSHFRGAGDAAGRLKRHRRCKGRKVLRRVRGKRKCVKRRVRRHGARAQARSERSGK